MVLSYRHYGWMLSLVGVFALIAGGCARTENNGDPAKSKGNQEKFVKSADANEASQVAKATEDHGWWCTEHGIPEETCGQCNAKIAAEFKKKGDWCKEHDRPDSQCFICHPELKAKFAAVYRTKYGKEPPQMEEEKPSKADQKK